MGFITLHQHGSCLWVQVRADSGSREQAYIGLESQAVSAAITNQFVTLLSEIKDKLQLPQDTLTVY